MAFDVKLCREQLLAAAFDLVMNVRRAARIGQRLDGAEQIFATRTRNEPAEALKVLILLLRVAGLAVQIRPVVVALPDFHDGIANWITFGIENSSAHVGHLADSRRERIVNHEQVVVRVERQVIGIERPFCLSRREQQVRKKPGGGEQRGAECSLAKKLTAARNMESCFHNNGYSHISGGSNPVSPA